MKFRGTVVVLAVAAVLGGFVYWHEVRGGKERAKERRELAKLVPVEAAQIESVDIAHSGMQFHLTRHNEIWVMTRPVTAPCDTRVIAAFLDTLAAARREDRVKGDLARYGLDAPAATLDIHASGQTHRVQLGRINPVQTLVYVLVDDSKTVLLTNKSLLDLSLNNAFGWRDKRMIEVQPELVQRLRFRTLVAGELTLRRDPDHGWLVEGPVPWRVDPVRAKSALLGLCQLQAVGVGAENKTELGKAGLGNRKFGAQVELANGTVVGDLVFGFALDQNAYYAMVPDKPEVFEVDGRLADLIVDLARDSRDRKACPPFDQNKITEIRVSSPSDRFVLRRRTGSDWAVAKSDKADTSFALDPGRMAGLLETMATLGVDGFPDQQPQRGVYDPPTVSVQLYAGEKLVSGLELGTKDPHGLHTFSRGPGEPAVFLVSPASLINLPIDLDRLKLDEKPAPEGADKG